MDIQELKIDEISTDSINVIESSNSGGKKSVNFDGTKIYMFLSVAENGYVCISGVTENELKVFSTDCGIAETKIQQWNAVN